MIAIGFTPLLRLKRCHACDQYHCSRVSTPLTGYPFNCVQTLKAHHLDIRASNPLDPPSVVECRVKQKVAIARWIAEWRANPPAPYTAIKHTTTKL
jgi:hypothetical protein